VQNVWTPCFIDLSLVRFSSDCGGRLDQFFISHGCFSIDRRINSALALLARFMLK
jgi:hypothetical protein